MKKFERNELSWNLYSWTIIAAVLILQLMKWRLLPMFMDYYYHLLVMLGFEHSGGYVAEAFWEYAPVGRPHLYPPLLHIIMLGFYKLGLSALFIARIFSVFLYPLLLSVVWWFGVSIFGRRLGFFAVLLCTASYYFYLDVSNMPAFSLALVFGLLSAIKFEKNNPLCAALILTLVFYSHLLAAVLFFLGIIILSLLKKRFFLYLKFLMLALILSFPLLLHQVINRKYFSFIDAPILHDIYIHPFIYICAGIGGVVCLFNRRRYHVLSALFLGFLPLLLFNYRYRLLSGQGEVIFMLLGALGADFIFERVLKLGGKAVKGALVFLLIFAALTLYSPVFFFSRHIHASFMQWGSAFANLVLPDIRGEFDPLLRNYDATMYVPKFIGPIVKIIKDNSGPDEIIYSDINYAGGMLSVLSDRFTSSDMLPQVKPYAEFEPIDYSKLVIIFKTPQGYFPYALKGKIEKYGLEKIIETDTAFIYKNPNSKGKIIVPSAFIPDTALFFVVFLMFVLIIFSWGRLSKIQSFSR